MATYRIEDSTLKAIANAIRAKTGGRTQLSTNQIIQIITNQLQYPTGSMTILTDGTYDVASCSSVSVETGSSGGDLLSYHWNEATLTLTVVEREDSSGGGGDDSGDDPGGDPGEDTQEHDCEIDGHEYVDGYCQYCGEPESESEHDCATEGHDYVEGYCIYCGEPESEPEPE